jgi:HK97 family phage portal protein
MRSLLGPLLNRAQISYAGHGDDRHRLGSLFGRSGPTSQMNAMGASATLFSIVNRTSTATAKLDWHLHAPAPAGQACEYGQGTEDECGEVGVMCVDKHPALVVLDKPNPFYTKQELFESGQQHVDLTGEGWLVVSYLGRIPAELWVARPDRMIVVTDPRDYLLGYLYVGPDGREQPLKARDVLSMRMPNPMDPYRGMGPVQTIMAQVSGAALSAEWNANFYRNGARPGGIVKLRRGMPDKEFDKLVERWNYDFKGVANAGRTAFLEEGDWVDVKPMSVADMQLVETSNLNRDTVLLAYGASKYDVGVLEDVNRASATAASNDFAERMTVPRADRWKGMLNNDFLPLFPGALEQGLCFVYTSPIKRERAEKRADALTSAQVFEILTSVPGIDPLWAAEVAGLPEPVLKEIEPAPAPVVVPSTTGEPLPIEEAQNRARALLARFQAIEAA